MWFEFAAIALILCAMLLLPGYFTARSFGMPRVWSACLAPILSISLICIMGQLLAFANVVASPLLVLAPIIIIPIFAFVVARNRIRTVSLPDMAWWLPVAFLAVGVALGAYLFIHQLPRPDSLFQAYDVTQHLNLIQAFADAGRFSSLGVSSYLSPADQMIDPVRNAGFYPAAWHVLCALAVSLTNFSGSLAINASMFVFGCMAYPLSTLVFLHAVFPHQKRTVIFGCFVALAFVAFPWALFVFGPVYPNLAGFATVPAVMALFIMLTREKSSAAQRVRLSALLLIALMGQALLHPNTLFTCAVILVPYCTHRIWNTCKGKRFGNGRSLLVCLVFIVFCAAVWLLCFKLPFMQDTVTHIWPPYAGRMQEIVNILTQTYTMGFFYEIAAQLLLGALVVIGFVRALHDPSLRWLAISYLLTCFICLESAVRSDEFKQLVAGFWYTDPMRLAAMAVIVATPLAALGLAWLHEVALSLVNTYNAKRQKQTHVRKVAAVVVCLFLAFNFAPAFNLPGMHMQLTSEQLEQSKSKDWVPPTNIHTAFGDYRAVFQATYTADAPLSEQERLFLDEVNNVVPKDAVVINDPMDGSFLAYGVDGIRVYYRNFVGFGCDNETPQSELIRTRLDDYSTDATVRDAVRVIGAQYVLVLSQAGSDSSFINLRDDYDPSEFAGISSITNDTPGFTCVRQQGDMRLYEIDAQRA
ncbi:DUF6541 family protein [Gordonibacter massiliensis (ex Traore et al. 2017)]|uniref:DUF6541 family protein n=1 Tax=Gordonibacter massiliensis (ex Traore et al. 2017) TaxID=1841863 RepID=UPI001C8C0043|nr:DUF6541 family protein [Gordonibacter massiliensis (ex Traore et al. 2017)]MBX9033628.1 hypothetical protein [Gordonibacter massiliensis (ex Traore et al. 2017)]